MIHGQNDKIVQLFAPQSVATNGTASGTVSCVGFDYAEILLSLATAAASNVDGTVAVSEGDGTSFATATEMNVTTVAPNTSTPQLYKWSLDLRKRKKNLKIQYNPNTNVARVASCVCRLSRAETVPDSLTEKGLDAHVIA